MPQFDTTPIPYVEIGTQAAAVRTAIDAAQLSAANSFGGLQKLAIPGPFATDAEASTGGVPDDNLYYRSDGTVRAASHISLDLAFALDKTLTARTGPTPTFTRASGATYVGSDGLIHGIDTSTTSVTFGIGSKTVTLSAPLGQDQMWRVGDAVEIVNSAGALMFGTVTSYTASTQDLVCDITSSTGTGAFTTWRIGYRGPRFDHDPATGDCKGLLIEESRSNICLRSENFGTTWSTFNSSTSLISQVAPNGDPSAYSLVESVGLGIHSIFQSIAFAGTTNYTFSVFVKAGSRDFVSLVEQSSGGVIRRTFFNLSTGEVGTKNASHTASTQQLPNGWWRLIISFTSGTAASANIAIELASADNVSSYLGNGSGNAFLWGAQLEAGAFPTSYIPTIPAEAARSADVCSIIETNFSSFYNQVEGTLFAECQAPSANQYAGIAVIGATSFNHNIALFKSDSTGGTLGDRFVPYVTQAGTLVALYDFGIGSGNGLMKVAASVALNNMIFARNGTISPADLTAAMPTPNRLTIGARADGNYINGHIARIQYFRKRLSNAKLQTLTAP